ncbi:hypothetical protein PQX77_002246, partial [Marasmius sp. AFHP31]
VTPRGESTYNLTTSAWRDHGIESVRPRPTSEDTQRRASESSDVYCATSPPVENVASQDEEVSNSTVNIAGSVGSIIEVTSGPIIPMYLRPPSRDTITSTTLPNGEGDAEILGRRCHMWYRMEVLLSQYTFYGELCCVAELLDALAECATTDNQISYPPRSRVNGEGTSGRWFEHFRNWWATRKPCCGDQDVFPRAPSSLYRDKSLSNGSDGGYESKLKTEARRRAKEVHLKLQTEWMTLVVWLSALAAIDSAIFALTLESAVTVVSPAARIMVIASGICAVFGILLVTWFIWKFCWTSSIALGNLDEFM